MRKRLGGGLQYSVYQISESRVRKVPASLLQKISFCVACGYPLRTIQESIREVDALARTSIAELKARGSALPRELLGNPTFEEGIEYEQDLITPVGTYIQNKPLDVKKRIFDGYVENTLALWDYGIAEEVFNFTVNNGVTEEGKVILSDLGELCFAKDDIAELIEQKLWLTQRSFKEIRQSDRDFSVYIESEMEKHITLAELNKRWRIRP